MKTMKRLSPVLLLVSVMFCFALAELESPYCYKTVTVVEKTKGFRKIFKKTKETTKIEKRCCEGYIMLEDQDTCKPICKQGCPSKATCTKPDHCQCDAGYELSNGSFSFCKPICTPICNDQEACVAPNQCACINKAIRHPITKKCDTNLEPVADASKEILHIFKANYETTTERLVYDENDHATSRDEEKYLDPVDSNEEANSENSDIEGTTIVYEESSEDDSDLDETTIIYIETSTAANNCFLYGCMENGFCQLSGQCICSTNFTLYFDEDLQEKLCLHPEEYEHRLLLKENSSFSKIALVLIFGITAFVLFAAIVLFIYLRRQKMRLDIQAKNDLCCEYNTTDASLKVL